MRFVMYASTYIQLPIWLPTSTRVLAKWSSNQIRDFPRDCLVFNDTKTIS